MMFFCAEICSVMFFLYDFNSFLRVSLIFINMQSS